MFISINRRAIYTWVKRGIFIPRCTNFTDSARMCGRIVPPSLHRVSCVLSVCLESLLKCTHSVHTAVLFLHRHPLLFLSALRLTATRITEQCNSDSLWHRLFQVHYYAMRCFFFFFLLKWQADIMIHILSSNLTCFLLRIQMLNECMWRRN